MWLVPTSSITFLYTNCPRLTQLGTGSRETTPVLTHCQTYHSQQQHNWRCRPFKPARRYRPFWTKLVLPCCCCHDKQPLPDPFCSRQLVRVPQYPKPQPPHSMVLIWAFTRHTGDFEAPTMGNNNTVKCFTGIKPHLPPATKLLTDR